jgi:hypothetical protein
LDQRNDKRGGRRNEDDQGRGRHDGPEKEFAAPTCQIKLSGRMTQFGVRHGVAASV